VLALGGAKRRALLARLLLDANRAVPFDALVDANMADTFAARGNSQITAG
jgi:hypothetical protein